MGSLTWAMLLKIRYMQEFTPDTRSYPAVQAGAALIYTSIHMFDNVILWSATERHSGSEIPRV